MGGHNTRTKRVVILLFCDGAEGQHRATAGICSVAGPGEPGLACSRFHVHDVKTPTYSMSVLIAHFR
jgi:hypothetical protein